MVEIVVPIYYVLMALICWSAMTVSIMNKERRGKVAFFAIAAVILMAIATAMAVAEIKEEARVTGEGNYYEIVATVPVPTKGILVYAVDLDGSEGKADILTEYPLKGYKIEQVEGRTFLLPMGATVAVDGGNEIFILSDDDEVIDIPTHFTGR